MRQLRLRIREEHTVIELEQDGAYTFIKIRWGAYSGRAFSKYNPFDMKRGLPYSKEMGILKATNKAIEDVARQYDEQTSLAVLLPPDALPKVLPPGIWPDLHLPSMWHLS